MLYPTSLGYKMQYGRFLEIDTIDIHQALY